jgi:hypothetical protein
MKRILFAAFTLSLMFATNAVAQSDSSLVQASKQKSTDKKAKRVFTNDDYPEKPELSPAPAAATMGATASDAKGDAKKEAPATLAEAKPAEGKPEDGKADEKKPEAKETKQAELERKLDTSKKEEQDLRQKLAKLQEKATRIGEVCIWTSSQTSRLHCLSIGTTRKTCRSRSKMRRTRSRSKYPIALRGLLRQPFCFSANVCRS